MIEVEIEDDAWAAAVDHVKAIADSAARAALRAAVVQAPDADVVVLLTGDAALADLNQRFRGKAGPTNVLSFPALEAARPHIGDIAIAYGVCTREAREQGKSLKHHLMHLVVHGVLHLVGYDHETESEAEDMEALERRVLAGLGAPDPYAPAAPDGGHGG
jgi:probable rRNA maturation factor